MITVKELIQKLQNKDPNAVVILQRDPEGNGHSPVQGVDGTYAWNDQQQIFGYAEITPDLKRQGFGDDDIVSGIPAVVIWPAY